MASPSDVRASRGAFRLGLILARPHFAPTHCRYGLNVRARSRLFGYCRKSALSCSCRSRQPNLSERRVVALVARILNVSDAMLVRHRA
jgi:hypothetical protein